MVFDLKKEKKPKQNSLVNSANTILTLLSLITRLQNLVRIPLDNKLHKEEIEGQGTIIIFIF